MWGEIAGDAQEELWGQSLEGDLLALEFWYIIGVVLHHNERKEGREVKVQGWQSFLPAVGLSLPSGLAEHQLMRISSRPLLALLHPSPRAARSYAMSTSSPLPFVKLTTLGTARVDESLPLENSDARWVGLRKLKWTDQEGKARLWEVAARKTTGTAGVDAVAIAAILKHPTRPVSIPVILQYRPPIGAVCVELPAGLVDASESAETAAMRELHEETGYGGEAFEGRVKLIEIGGVVPSCVLLFLALGSF